MAAPDDFEFEDVPQTRQIKDENLLKYLSQRNESRNYDRSVAKSVPQHMEEQGFADDAQTRSKSGGPQMKDAPVLNTIRTAELSLMHLLCTSDDPQENYEAVVRQVTELTNTDFVQYPDTAKILGNFYDACNYSEYLVSVFSHEETEKVVLDFRRMTGHAFAFDSFFRTLKKSLAENEVVEVDEDEEESSDFDFSDDDEDDKEEEPEQSYLQQGAFLKLSYDPNLVSVWVQRMKTRSSEDQLHVAGLMGHNSQDPTNLEIMLDNQRDEIREMLNEKLASDSQINCALTFFLCKFLQNISNYDRDFVDDDLLKAVLNTLQKWCPGNSSQKDFEVHESRGVVRCLTQVLNNTLDAKSTNFDEYVRMYCSDQDSKSLFQEFVKEEVGPEEHFRALNYIIDLD